MPSEVKVGSPTLTVNFYTRSKVYELHSKIGDPNTDILSVSTSKELKSPTGSFNISLVPETDKEGKTWSDKLEVFDYVEIFMKGIDDPDERIIMRGLIDDISMGEEYSSDVPTRTISIAGRDLGSLFVDFSVWYEPLLDPKAALSKMASWIKEIRPQGYSAEELFDEFFEHMKYMFELTVGKPTYIPASDWQQTKAAWKPKDFGSLDATRKTFVQPSTTVNLATKIDRKVKSFFPELRTVWAQFIQFEGAYWNLFQNFQDKPFHEMFIWDADDNAKFVYRPGRLKDMKANYHDNVLSAMEEMGKSAYPPDFSVRDVDKISMNTKRSLSQLQNYFFTYPETQGGKGKNNMLSLAVLAFVDNPSEAVNPFLSIRPTVASQPEGLPSAFGDEPMSYIGRYGRRAYEVPVQFFLQDIGQILQANSKDPDHPPKDPLASKFNPLENKPGNDTGKKVSQWEPLVEKHSQAKNATKPLVYAILDSSSGGDPKKTTTNRYTLAFWKTESEDVGLMQINTKKDPAYTSSTDPDKNIEYGCAKIARLEQKYPGDKKKVIAAYKNEQMVEEATSRAGESGDWFKQLPDCGGFSGGGEELQEWTTKTLSLTAQYYLKLKPEEGFHSKEAEKELADKNAGPSRTAMSLLKDPYIGPALRYNFILVCWYLHNHYLLGGSMNIRGTNQAIIGTYVKDKDGEYLNLDGSRHKGMEYYVEGVSHNFVVFSSYTTALTIERGQPEQYGLYGQGYRGKWYFDQGIVPTSFRQKITISPTITPPETTPDTTPANSGCKAGFIPLPPETPTCGYHYYGAPDHKYGRPDTISAIQATCAKWYQAHPTGPRLNIGDISKECGGETKRHPSGHRLGNEVDVRPLRNDGGEGPMNISSYRYSKPLTTEAMNIFRQNGMRDVRIVMFGDNTINGVYFDRSGGHNDHFHVGFQGEGKVAVSAPSQDNRLPFPEKAIDGTPVPQTLEEAIKALKKKESNPPLSGDGDYLFVAKTGMYYSPDRITGKVSGIFVGKGTDSVIRWSDSKDQRTVKVTG